MGIKAILIYVSFMAAYAMDAVNIGTAAIVGY